MLNIYPTSFFKRLPCILYCETIFLLVKIFKFLLNYTTLNEYLYLFKEFVQPLNDSLHLSLIVVTFDPAEALCYMSHFLIP